MAPESCNLGKDEAEMLKPSSPSSSPSSPTSNHSSSSASPQPSLQPPPSCLSLKPLDVVQAPTSERSSAAIKVASLSKLEERSQLQAQFGNRCLTCRKRISLSGFRCRCGDLFCARHRYSDTHDCSFDYKAAGRAEISKANPLVRAAKIIKI